MTYLTGFLPQDAVAYLQFAEGDTRFPIRPIPVGDFLVGSGGDCDLRLGDAVLPPLHSVVRISETGASWTRLVRQPELIVNGDAVRQSELHDGDIVEIGPFRMQFRFARDAASSAGEHSTATTGVSEPEVAARMGALELVEAIERETVQLTELDRALHDGLSELLVAVREQRTAGLVAGAPADRPTEVTRNFGEALEILRLQTKRLETLTEVVEHVVTQQGLLSESLRVLAEHLAAFAVQQSPLRRAG